MSDKNKPAIYSFADEEQTVTVQWRRADGRGCLLVVTSDGSATFSVKRTSTDNYAWSGVPFALPDALAAAIREICHQ